MGSENVVTNYLKAITGESGGMTSMIIMVLITIVNVILTSVKAYESGLDGSMSVASSALESFGDVFSCFVIGYYRYKEMTASPKKFPHGRSARAQAYNICAYIMISVAVGALLIDLDRIIIKEVKSILEMRDAIVMFVNVIVKCLLLLLCYSQRHHSELKILMMDQANDVFTNSVTIGAIFLAMYIHVIFDFLGAILICGWVVRNWLKVLSKNNKRVHGHIVRKEILENLKEVARNCSQVDHLFEMVAYYNGEPIVVEAYIRPVGDYHEAVEQLQSALLAIDEVQTVHVFPGNEKKYQKGRMSKITMESSKLERIIEEDETEDHHSVSQKSADEDCISDEGNLDDTFIFPVGDYNEAVEQLHSAHLALDEIQTVQVFPGNEKLQKYQKGRMSKITVESSKLVRNIVEDGADDHHSVSQKSADVDITSEAVNLEDGMSSDDHVDITSVVSPTEKVLPPV